MSKPLDREGKGTTTMSESLGEAYPIQQQRCRELLEQYKTIGPAGAFGHMMISQVLQRADKAAISGDVVEIIRSYEEMKGCE